MKKPETIEIYRQRIAAAIEYIDRNLDGELALASIAAVANFSPFHFHRIFKAFRGEPLGGYITRRRVETAARLLRESGQSVEAIAYDVGFEAPASLNRAFRQYYDATPSEYRSTKNQYIMKTSQANPSVKLKAPKMMELEPKTAICVSFTGDYKHLDYSGAFARLWAAVKSQGLYSAGIEHIGIFHDDPKSTDPSKLRTDVCLVVRKPAEPEGDISVKTIAGGRYAVFSHTGPYNEVGAIYDAIYSEWVPANCACGDDCGCGDDCKCTLRDEPVFEKYVNDPDRTAPEKLKTEIYVPIK